MGTTLAALQSGSANYVYVVAIEGYRYLLTNHHTSSAAVTAFATKSGGDWTQALGGLYVDLQNAQSISPSDALTRGGQCTLHVMPDPTATTPDQFGIDVAKRGTGWETELTASVNRSDATLNVKSTALMGTSGICYLGTEALGYSVTSDTTMFCSRGLWSPFAANGDESEHFAEHHRVVVDPQAAKLRPLVTQYPRTWLGKWVGVWMHRVVGGVLDTVAEAQLVFAGRIADIKDDDTTGATVVDLKHVLDYIRETSIGRDMWSASLREGMYLVAGWGFGMIDFSSTAAATYKVANSLMVVSSGASGANQIDAGYYTLSDICVAITTWLQSEKAASRIYGDYSMSSPVSSPQGPRTKIYWQIGTSTGVDTRFVLGMPKPVAVFLGYATGTLALNDDTQFSVDKSDSGGQIHHALGVQEPQKSALFYYLGTMRVQIDDERGTLVDQYNSLPAACVPPSSGGRSWGIFLIDDQFMVWGSKGTDGLQDLKPLTSYGEATTLIDMLDYTIPFDRESVSIRQVFVFETSEATLLKWLLLSTGTPAYNDSTYDVLGYGLGLGIPAGLCSSLQASIDALPGADASLITIIDKPANVNDLLSGDLALRRAFTRWKNGSIEFGTWKVPTLAASVASLGEDTKAAPAGTQDSHRATTLESSEWARPIVKIQFNRDITDSASGDGYLSTVTLEDSTAVDDLGGDAPAITIRARNTYGQHVLTGAGVEALIPGYLAMLPLFSRPKKSLSRSLDPRWWEGLAVGDIVDITDAFARDPATGTRGVSSRPALITTHKYSPGGAMPPTGDGDDPVNPAGGEIQAYFLDVERIYAYGPAADVDESATNAGYVVVTKVLTCKAHSFSESGAAADASWFHVGHKVTVTEIDPSGSPLAWSDTVAAQSGNTITMTTGLAGWDNTKRYRVRFDNYGSAVSAQRAFAFEADATTGALSAGGPPNQYNIGQAESTYTINVTPSAGPVELLPTDADGADVSRDVGYEAALIQLINNTLDYKTAVSSPCLHSKIDGTDLPGASAWKLISVSPIYLGADAYSNAVIRYVSVAPFFRSISGTSSARISISRTAPTGTSIYDVDRGPVYREAVFLTSSSTYATPTAQLIKADVKNANGTAWIYLEVTTNAETCGIARCTVGPR